MRSVSIAVACFCLAIGCSRAGADRTASPAASPAKPIAPLTDARRKELRGMLATSVKDMNAEHLAHPTDLAEAERQTLALPGPEEKRFEVVVTLLTVCREAYWEDQLEIARAILTEFPDCEPSGLAGFIEKSFFLVQPKDAIEQLRVVMKAGDCDFADKVASTYESMELLGKSHVMPASEAIQFLIREVKSGRLPTEVKISAKKLIADAKK
jgi:hypothetical protein